MENRIKYIIEDVLKQNGYSVNSIYLFGSRARGDFEEESDYDLLVIINNTIDMKQKKEIWRKIYHHLHENLPLSSFDLIIKNALEFEEEKDIVNTISNEAIIEGIKI